MNYTNENFFFIFLPGLGQFSLKINRKIMKKTKELQQESVKPIKSMKIPEIRAKLFFDDKEKELPYNCCIPCSVFLNLVDMYFTKLLSFFSCGFCDPTVAGILKIPFSLILMIFLYRNIPKTRKKDIFKIPATVGLQSPQLKNDNSFVKHMSTIFKHTEQGIQQLCGSFFFLLSKNIFARISGILMIF